MPRRILSPPPLVPTLTQRDREILEILTRRVKVLTVPQIVRTWWSGTYGMQSARRRIEELEEAGLVRSFTAYAHPELPMLQPVFHWTPGSPPPIFGALSYQLVSRWTEPHAPVTSLIATKKAGTAFGGYGGKRPKRVEENHDIHLAAVFLQLRATSPALARCWISEEFIRRSRPNAPGEKLPDAIVRPDGSPEKIVDFGGEYSPAKLESFHRWAEEKARAYEFW